MRQWLNTFLKSNDTAYRLLRTIAQGIIGVIISNIDMIVGTFSINPTLKPMIVALSMCVLSPIMAELGAKNDGAQQLN